MTITHENDTATIEFGNKLPRRTKTALALQSIGYLGGCLIFLVFAALVANGHESFVAILFCLTFSVAGFVAFTRVKNRQTNIETVTITPESIIISNIGLFKKEAKEYDITAIEAMYYRGAPTKTDHHLKTGGFDYMGFETQEAMIGRVNTDGNINFHYGNALIDFGKDIYSSDAIRISEVLSIITDNRLSILNIPPEITDWGEGVPH